MGECTVRETLPPLCLHVPPLDMGLRPTPTFMKMFPDYVIDVSISSSASRQPFDGPAPSRARASARRGGGPLHYRTEGRPDFCADRHMHFLRGWTNLFPTFQAAKTYSSYETPHA
jgi:hypothetical protein